MRTQPKQPLTGTEIATNFFTKLGLDVERVHFSARKKGTKGLTLTNVKFSELEGLRKDHHLYYTPAPHVPGAVKRTDSLPGDLIWVDVDLHNGGLSLAGALKAIKEACGVSPTVVASGSPGNYHLYIRLDRKLTTPRRDMLNKALSEMVGGDGKWPSNALLRVPGSLNHREPNNEHAHKREGDGRVRVVQYRTGTYNLRDVLTTLGVDVSSFKQANGLPEVRKYTGDSDAVPDVPNSLRHHLKGMLFPGESGGGADSSGSGGNYRLVCELFEAGYSLDDTATLILKYGGARKQGNNEEWLIEDIERCYSRREAKGRKAKASSEGGLVVRDFFSQTKELKHIHKVAMAELVHPWALLGWCLTHALAEVPGHVVIPGIVGAQNSLNLYTAIIGTSSGGKTVVKSATDNCFTWSAYTEFRTLTTGEGLFRWFRERDGDGKLIMPKGSSGRVIAYVDEIDTLSARAGRQGATLMGILNSMWNGSMEGSETAGKEGRVVVPQHSYRMCVVINAQPSRAELLLGQQARDNGFAGRILYLPTDNAGFPDDEVRAGHRIAWESPEWCGKVLADDREALKRAGGMSVSGGMFKLSEIDVADSIRKVIRRERILRDRGELEVGELDGHTNLMKLKVAIGLALLHRDLADGKLKEEWWDMAEQIMVMHRNTREGVIEVLRAAKGREAVSRGKADAAREEAHESEVENRVEDKVMGVLKKAADAGASTRELKRVMSGAKQQDVLAGVLDKLMGLKLIRAEKAGRGMRYWMGVERDGKRVD